jgi:hypothetical protein
MKVAGIILLFVGTVATAFASGVPEIDGSSSVSALALLSGSLLMLRGRRKK